MDSEKERMRLQLCKLIEDWNGNRLDLFALSQPNEELEFHGVMRFFFQEAGQKVATKCIRVSSTGTTRAVIDALIEKFHPDMRMLSTPKYSLWEVHENGEERQLRMDEKPLLVQLNWHKDDREGRFLLRRDNADATPLKIDSQLDEKQMKRKLSKREKKEQKKKEKRAIREAEDVGAGTPANLYAEVPPTTFTRTISNPEIVMKKRRERKLAEKLKNIGEGGSLKIYGEEVSGGAKPYVTLLVSIRDRTDRILREALDKYGIDNQRSGDEFYLAEVRSPLVEEDDENAPDDDLEHRPGQPQTERALDDDDCPLLIYAHDANKANITFHVRRKTPAVAREVEKRRKSKASISDAMMMDQQQVRTPCLIELTSDGAESARRHFIHPNVTEIGNDRTLAAPYGLPIHGPYVHPRHCVLAFMDGVVTVTPCSPSAELKIDERPISETTVLYNGQTIRIGRSHLYRFVDLGGQNGSMRVLPQEQQPMILKRIPSEQGMIRNGATPSSTTNLARAGGGDSGTIPLNGGRGGVEIGLISEGQQQQQRFATTFDVDGDVKTFVIPTLASPRSPAVGDGGGGEGFAFLPSSSNELSRGESAHRSPNSNKSSSSLTPTPMAPGMQQKDVVLQQQQQHYNRPPLATPVPESLLNQSQTSLAQQRRTPPIFPQPAQAGPPRPTNLFGRDAIPAIIELVDNAEDEFLASILRETQAERVHFKLAPAYVIYMCCRYRVSPHYRTGIRPEERNRRMAEFLTKVIGRMHVTIQDHCHESMPLAFWMANCSELLNFVKLDGELNACTMPEPQESMADAVQKAYDHLAAYFKQELHATMPSVLDLSLDDHAATSPCIHMLSGAMSVLRHCRVNAALTIQIFSQLFHYINMYLFNWLVSREGGAYCTRQWGVSLRRRLADIQAWSEKQGLEAAAECRLERILQASQLLQMPKVSENLSALHSASIKLNSLQIRSLLERYRLEIGEPPLDRDLIQNLVKVAEEQVDDVLRMDGQLVQLEEELDLQLPFLLPDDGYSPQVVRGIPNGLREFVENLLQRNICRMILQPSSSGSWTVHMGGSGSIGPSTTNGQNGGYQSPTTVPLVRNGSISSTSNLAATTGGTPPTQQGAPEIALISFQKVDGGIGLSIIQAQGSGQTQAGIYVKNVVAGSSAARDGRLEAGDQLLKVNGQSLVGISQDTAAKLMGSSGPVVHFEVAKGAVLYNGLATVIYQQSPDVGHRPSPPHQHQQHGLPRSPGGGSNQQQQAMPPPQHNRVRSVEHLPQHVIQQQQQRNGNGMPAQSNYSNVSVGGGVQKPPTPLLQHQYSQQPPPPTVQHQRYPSSSSLQQAHHYQQQPQAQINSSKIGPPPVQYHMQQRTSPPQHQQQQQQQQQYQYNNNGRSMSATHLHKDEPTTPTEVRRLLQQPQYENNQSMMAKGETAASQSMRSTPVFPPASGQAYIPTRHQQQQTTMNDEQYYQNLSQYQTQQQFPPMVAGSVARRMSASDYGSGVPLNQHHQQHQQHSPEVTNVGSAYANQEYHRLPTSSPSPHQHQQQIDQLGYHVHRAPPQMINNDFGHAPLSAPLTAAISPTSAYPPPVAYRNGTSASTEYQSQLSNAVAASNQLYYQNGAASMNGHSSSMTNGYARQSSQNQLPDYQHLMNSDASSQVPLRHQSTSSESATVATNHHQPHQRQASYPHQAPAVPPHHAQQPQYANQQVAGTKRKEQSPLPPPVRQPQSMIVSRRTSSTDSQEPLRYPTPTAEQQPIQQRLGQQAAAVAASQGQKWRSADEDDREVQIQSEVERLMREEVSRLESREYLSEDEHKRYRALKFELEYRRRLHSADNDNGGIGLGVPEDELINGASSTSPMMKIESEFDDILRSLEPVSTVNQRETAQTVVTEWRQSSDHGQEATMENSIKRQQMRDNYFEEAEQRYIEAAARERQMREGSEKDSMKSTKEHEDERKRDFARNHISELQSKLQNVGMNDEEPRPKTNGHHEHAPPPPLSPVPSKQPPEVPPKRKVVFNDSPDYAGMESTSSTATISHPPPVPPPVPEPQQPKKYVYDANPDEQQPRAIVIGAQEVYRDPRQERLKNLQTRKPVVAETEKLSFKDKMRLFAAEIGESTPKDRVKVSSAQRDIEGALNGSMTG